MTSETTCREVKNRDPVTSVTITIISCSCAELWMFFRRCFAVNLCFYDLFLNASFVNERNVQNKSVKVMRHLLVPDVCMHNCPIGEQFCGKYL